MVSPKQQDPLLLHNSSFCLECELSRSRFPYHLKNWSACLDKKKPSAIFWVWAVPSVGVLINSSLIIIFLWFYYYYHEIITPGKRDKKHKKCLGKTLSREKPSQIFSRRILSNILPECLHQAQNIIHSIHPKSSASPRASAIVKWPRSTKREVITFNITSNMPPTYFSSCS